MVNRCEDIFELRISSGMTRSLKKITKIQDFFIENKCLCIIKIVDHLYLKRLINNLTPSNDRIIVTKVKLLSKLLTRFQFKV